MNMLTLQVLFEIAQLLSNFDVGRDSVFTLLEKDWSLSKICSEAMQRDDEKQHFIDMYSYRK